MLRSKLYPRRVISSARCIFAKLVPYFAHPRLSNFIGAATFTAFFIQNIYYSFFEAPIYYIFRSVFCLLVVIFFFIRSNAEVISQNQKDVTIAICHFLTPLFIGLEGVALIPPIAAIVLVIGGGAVSAIALLDLGRALGLRPAYRGKIVSRGLYNFVRHPMYLGYMVGMTGLVLIVFSFQNALVYIAFLILTHLRIIVEEKLLLDADKSYSSYAGRVKCRLIPHVY